MQNFDLVHSPLKGIHLIEASAGTGKTYTIAGIFLRLVLEHRIHSDSVLIVTFTRAATEELKVRIRNNLLAAKAGFEHGQSQDPFIDTLIKKTKDPDQGLQRIKDALIDFDQAAIFTIHGFCHRVLHEFAFETQSLFDTDLVGESGELIREVAEDYWRLQLSALPVEAIGYFMERKRVTGPDFFLTILDQMAYPDIRIIPDLERPGLPGLETYRELLHQLKAAWGDHKEEVSLILKDPALNGRIYGAIKNSPNRPGMTMRDIRVLGLVEKMDRLLDEENHGFPLYDGFEKWTAGQIESATRKKFHTPTHPVFNLCERLQNAGRELEAEMDSLLLFLELNFIQFALPNMIQKKRNLNIRFYDDLLSVLYHALEEEKKKNSDHLVRMVRSRYKAALIDEFQDTDSLQYKLFEHIFHTLPMVFFMIGDPKQSIYSFRGADVFSYIHAAENADQKSTLTHNYRSDPGLITAVNTVFSRVENPFVYPEIPFIEGSCNAACMKKTNEVARPFKLWYLGSREKRPLSKAEAVPVIGEEIAREILGLVSGKKHAPGEIAILVRTNRQAKQMKGHLQKYSIPAVIYSAGNIFETEEVDEVIRVLRAVGEPANDRYFRAAMATDMIGLKAETLDRWNQENPLLDQKRAMFYQYHTTWNQDGFIRMFYQMIQTEGVKAHILSLPNGERRLTNILQLSELLHQISLEKKTGIKGLIKWLVDQKNSARHGPEEHLLRLESDDSAVKIVTIHKSKGLEYKVVFCPFCWEDSRIRSNRILFHDLDSRKRPTLDLSPEPAADHLVYAGNERLAENLRLLYVALTRARTMVYLVWGRINTAETSALAYLFHHPSGGRGMTPREDILRLVSMHVKGLSDRNILDDLQTLVESSDGTIELSRIPKRGDKTYPLQNETADQTRLSRRTFTGRIDHSWHISSYSSLLTRTPGVSRPGHIPEYDRDQFSGRDPDLIEREDPHRAGESKQDHDIYTFPRGSKAGLFFHEIFESIDFSEKNPGAFETLIRQKLEEYGYEEIWSLAVTEMVQNVLATPLNHGPDPICLNRISSENRISEMEFYFPMQRLTPEGLGRGFNPETGIKSRDDLYQLLTQLDFSPTRGYMKGYIDLVFKHQGRYYILDWKSNDLGPDRSAYSRDSLEAVMREHFYFLQYHIYTLALHQYLKLKEPEYEYPTGFGGIVYVFLRGTRPENGPGYGIYTDLPDPGRIERLGRTLIPDYR